jgi:hypothetical protein
MPISEVYNCDCLEGEIWKPVLKLWSFNSNLSMENLFHFKEGKYFVSNLGRFKRNGRLVNVKCDNVGTKTFSLQKHRFKLHQIVLQTFCPEGIKNGYSPDHIDRTKRNINTIYNLRWANRATQCTNRDNTTYKYKSVLEITTNKIYKSCQEAEIELGLAKNTVSPVARGEKKSIKGFIFRYV